MTTNEPTTGWHSLFDGKSLEGWRASDAPGTFSVRDGAIVVKGPRSHLFYVGPVRGHDFRDFELARRDELALSYPQHRELIERYTRG